jgi:hypothetical protein
MNDDKANFMVPITDDRLDRYKESFISEEAPPMRFVERDGKRILQHRVVINSFNKLGEQIGRYDQWRDVPLAKETDE